MSNSRSRGAALHACCSCAPLSSALSFPPHACMLYTTDHSAFLLRACPPARPLALAVHRFGDFKKDAPKRSAAEEDEARSREQYTGGELSGLAVLGAPTGGAVPSGVGGIAARARRQGPGQCVSHAAVHDQYFLICSHPLRPAPS